MLKRSAEGQGKRERQRERDAAPVHAHLRRGKRFHRKTKRGDRKFVSMVRQCRM